MNPIAWLEADMARHMLVEFPLLVLLGGALERYVPTSVATAIARFDGYGLTGWTFASLVLAFWMIPVALDTAIASAAVSSAKYTSLVAAGFAVRSALRRSPVVLEAFFIGNLVWMSMTVGLVYQTVESQLCLAYLIDSQQRAGIGLVIGPIAVSIPWLVRVVTLSGRFALDRSQPRI